VKNRYCSFFLYIFFIDAFLNILGNLTNLFGLSLLNSAPLKAAEGIFHGLFIVLAIVQVVIAFKNKLRWSAKILGLYPLFFTLIALFVGIAMMITKKPSINESNASVYATIISVYILILGIGELLIGIWAKRDLSGGHYILGRETREA